MFQFFFEDNGIGFDESQLETIFTFFKRLAITDEFTGSGIGLSTTMKIVKRYCDTITASTFGKGSTFVVTLPFTQKNKFFLSFVLKLSAIGHIIISTRC